MSQRFIALMILVLALACDDATAPVSNTPVNGSDISAAPLPGEPDGILLAALRGEASVEQCENGGVVVAFGVDEDSSGELEDDEIDGTDVICNGLNGVDGQDRRKWY